MVFESSESLWDYSFNINIYISLIVLSTNIIFAWIICCNKRKYRSIIHIVCYRDRRYQKRQRVFDDEPAVQEKNEPQELDEPEPEIPDKGLPEDISEIGDHAFSKDKSLTIADIPAGIKVLGPAAFANCHNLRVVCIPLSVEEIAYNCFFNTPKLKTINYAGTKDEWSKIIRGSNWLTNAGTTVVSTLDGKITVDPKN